VKRSTIAKVLGVSLVTGGVYAAVAAYGASKVTTRVRKLAEVRPETIAPDWEAVSFESRADRKRLEGWWFPAAGDRALILVHGHGQNRIDKNWGTDQIARAFLARGYSVLVFDLRGHGESANDRLSFGVRERNDVLGAFDLVRGRGIAPARIALIGISYGAASLLLAAPELRDAGAIVADSSFAEIWPVIAAEIPRQQPVIARLRPRHGIQLAARLLYRVNLEHARPIGVMAALAHRPILFIHGADDDYVPPAHAERLHAAHGHPDSELWLVPGASHAATYMTAPDEFIERVSRFIDAQIGSRNTPDNI
jgi:uncharacterized protein